MITITVSTPDRTLHTVDFDPDELRALAETISLGYDYVADTGRPVAPTAMLRDALYMHS